MLREIGFSLESELGLLKDRIDEIEEEQDELARKAEEWQEKDERERDGNQYKRLKKTFNNLENERVEKESKRERFVEYVEEWEDDEFRVRELSFGEVQEVKDIVSQESFEVDVELQEIEGTPLQGVYQSEVLRRAVEDMPKECGNDPRQLPEMLGDWLMEKVESVNSLEDENLSTESLDDRIN